MNKFCVLCIIMLTGCNVRTSTPDRFLADNHGKARLVAVYFAGSSTLFAIVEGETGERKKIAVFPHQNTFVPMVVGDTVIVEQNDRGVYQIVGLDKKVEP